MDTRDRSDRSSSHRSLTSPQQEKSPRAVRKLIGLTQLLLKILETSNVNADAKAISAAWRKFSSSPKNVFKNREENYNSHILTSTLNLRTAEGQEKPTPRAITERIHRIRSMSKSTGGDSAPSTPRKATASRPQTSEKGEVTGSKRKRGGLKAER